MGAHEQSVRISVGGDHIAGTLVCPATLLPGMLFVHGWRGSQKQYLMRAREIAALGCICLAIDLRGHAESSAQRHEITREDSLQDVTASYDFLAQADAVDESAIGVVGSSYGGYLAAILTSMRPVKWLAVRSSATAAAFMRQPQTAPCAPARNIPAMYSWWHRNGTRSFLLP